MLSTEHEPDFAEQICFFKILVIPVLWAKNWDCWYGGKWRRGNNFFFFRRGFAWQTVRIICLNRQEGFIFVSFLVVLKFKDIINDGGIGLPENMCKEENDLWSPNSMHWASTLQCDSVDIQEKIQSFQVLPNWRDS